MSKYRFEDIVFNITDKKKPLPEDRNHYVGLEHLDSFSLKVVRWGSDVDIIGDKLIMKKGDVLFGRRRAYQRKVGIAPFDGIFSAHGMIFRPKEKVIDPLFLPYFIMSDVFMNRAIAISVGSLSPTVNWKTLKEEVFYLPALEEQSKIVRVLMEMDTLRQKYGQAIENTDALVKSQFIEMFGICKKKQLSEIADITMGQSPSSEYYNDKGEGLPFYQGKTEYGDMYLGKPNTWCTDSTRIAEANDILLSVRAPVGSVNIATEKCCIGRGLAAISPILGKSTMLYLFYALRAIANEIERLGVGSTFASVTKQQVYSLLLPDADIDEQEQFVRFAEQSDKLKFHGITLTEEVAA